MNFSELAKERYSVRSYKNQPVETEKLLAVLEAGRVAPTACNNQPQRIKLITSAGELAKVDECTPFRFEAPAVLLVCYDKKLSWVRKFDRANSGEIDASIVATHMMMAAWELGLGSCWVMYFDPAKLSALFGLPENIVPVALLPMGYPAAEARPASGHGEKGSLENMLLK